jgi:hypothetical protein
MRLKIKTETKLAEDHSIARLAHTNLVSLRVQPQVN